MKNILFYSCVFALLIVGACKKEGLKTYDNDSSKNPIYFAEAKSLANQKFITFGYAKNTVKDSLVTFIVRAIGAPEDHDRPYNLSIGDSSTLKNGTEYEILNQPLSIKTGKVADTLKIKLLRATTLRNGPFYLYMDIKPNDNFTNDYLYYTTTTNGITTTSYHTRMTLKVDDIAGPPPFWTVGSSYYSYTVGYLGTFSQLKFQLLVSYFNLNVDELVGANWFLTNGNYRRMSGWADGLKSYLSRMATNGTPIYEADGTTLMTMGVNAK